MYIIIIVFVFVGPIIIIQIITLPVGSFPLLLAFVVEGLGIEFCVIVAGWKHALRSEWPFIIILLLQTGWGVPCPCLGLA